jgi:predicted lipoprotein with Yx(FWY)xxD motif
MRNLMAGAAGLAGIALLAAACSSGSGSTTSSTTTTPAASPSAAAPTTPAATSSAAAQPAGKPAVSLSSTSGIPGKFLVGSNGRTLYLWEADQSGKSTCSGACAAAWPPDIVTGTPKAGSGVSQSLLSTIKRSDGSMQLAYNGHPLYYFTGDSAAGTAMGQGSKAFGAGWYVVNASGSKIDTS